MLAWINRIDNRTFTVIRVLLLGVSMLFVYGFIRFLFVLAEVFLGVKF